MSTRRLRRGVSRSLIFHMFCLALLYLANTQLSLILLRSVDSPTIALGQSATPLLTGVLVWVCLTRHIAREKWIAILLQLIGLVLVVHDPTASFTGSSRSTRSLLLLSALLTGLCGIITEYVVNKFPVDIMSQSTILAGFGAILHLLCFVFDFDSMFVSSSRGESIPTTTLDLSDWLVIFARGMTGIAIMYIYRRGDVLMATFANACVLAPLAIINSLVFERKMELDACLGIAIVLIATSIYIQVTLRESSRSSLVSPSFDGLDDLPTVAVAHRHPHSNSRSSNSGSTFRCCADGQRYKLILVIVIIGLVLIATPLPHPSLNVTNEPTPISMPIPLPPSEYLSHTLVDTTPLATPDTDLGLLEQLDACIHARPYLYSLGPLSLDSPLRFRGLNLESQCSLFPPGDDDDTIDTGAIGASSQPIWNGFAQEVETRVEHLKREEENRHAIQSMDITVNDIPCYVTQRSPAGDAFECRLQGLLGVSALPVNGTIRVSVTLRRSIRVSDHASLIQFTSGITRRDGPQQRFRRFEQPADIRHETFVVRDFKIQRQQTYWEEKGIILGIFFSHARYERIPHLRPLHRLFPLIVYVGPDADGSGGGVRPDRQGLTYIETPIQDWLQSHGGARRVIEEFGGEMKILTGGLFFIHVETLPHFWLFQHTPHMFSSSQHILQPYLRGEKPNRDIVSNFTESWWHSSPFMYAALLETFKQLKDGAEGRTTSSSLTRISDKEREVYQSALDNFERNYGHRAVYGAGDIIYLPYRFLAPFLILEPVLLRTRLMHDLGWPHMVGFLSSSSLDSDVRRISPVTSHQPDVTRWMAAMPTSKQHFRRLRWELPVTKEFIRVAVERSLPYTRDQQHRQWSNALNVGEVELEAACPEPRGSQWRHDILTATLCTNEHAPTVESAESIVGSNPLPADRSVTRSIALSASLLSRVKLLTAGMSSCYRCVVGRYQFDTAHRCWRAIDPLALSPDAMRITRLNGEACGAETHTGDITEGA